MLPGLPIDPDFPSHREREIELGEVCGRSTGKNTNTKGKRTQIVTKRNQFYQKKGS